MSTDTRQAQPTPRSWSIVATLPHAVGPLKAGTVVLCAPRPKGDEAGRVAVYGVRVADRAIRRVETSIASLGSVAVREVADPRLALVAAQLYGPTPEAARAGATREIESWIKFREAAHVRD